MTKRYFALIVVVAVFVAVFAWRATRPPPSAPTPLPTAPQGATTTSAIDRTTTTPASTRDAKGFDSKAVAQVVGAQKAALLGKIAKDYEELTTKTAADFTAQGAAYPGGFNAYLRQLALLEREKWKDYAAVLTTRELEDLQMRDHHAGKVVTTQLGDTTATDEQRRAVLRLQRDFDDKYSLIFDLTAPALLARETERQAVQEQIATVLGPDLFAAWLRGEGGDYGQMLDYAKQNGIRTEAALEAWRVKNEFVRRRLEITAKGATSDGQTLNALIDQTRTRLTQILGPAAVQSPSTSGLSWLPAR